MTPKKPRKKPLAPYISPSSARNRFGSTQAKKISSSGSIRVRTMFFTISSLPASSVKSSLSPSFSVSAARLRQ